MSHMGRDTDAEGNLSVEEVLMEKQEEREEIAATEVVNEGEPLADEEWLAQYNEEQEAE